MNNSNIYIKYNFNSLYSKEFISSFSKSDKCSFVGCKNHDESTVYLECKNILEDDYTKKYYNTFNIVYFGSDKFPIMLDNYIASYIYYKCDNYSEYLNSKIIEYLNNNTCAIEMKIRQTVNKFKLEYLVYYTASNLFVYDKSKSIYIYSDIKSFEILTDNNLKYFKDNKYNLIPHEKVNRFLII